MALVPAKKSLVMGYRVLSCILIVVGAVVPVQTVWDLVDFASAFLVFFNVIALIGLSKYVAYVLKDYGRKWKTEDHPQWDYAQDITQMDLNDLK